MTSATPYLLTAVPDEAVEHGDGLLVVDFIEHYCRSTKTTVASEAGEPLRLRQWQYDLIGRTFARDPKTGHRLHRVAIWGLPRKNGKSALGSGIGLFGIVCEDDGAEVYSCAADKEQAKIVFGVAADMVKKSPVLSNLLTVRRDAIINEATGSVYKALSSEAFTKEGLSPTLVVYDELHAAPNRELWDVMNLGSGARHDPLVLAITTAGVRSDNTGGDSICYTMFNHLEELVAGATQDPEFYGEWWASDLPMDDPEGDRLANPGYGDLISEADFESVKRRTPFSEYMTKRRNLFMSTMRHWFAEGVFESNGDDTIDVPKGERVALAFDGSFRRDSTGLVGCTIDRETPHVFVVESWQRTRTDDEHWKVPTAEVMDTIRRACSTWNVAEVACDPWGWRDQLEELEAEGLPMTEFPQTPSRMVPACTAFADRVVEGRMTHDADPRLELHTRNCHTKPAHGGVHIVKGSKDSPAKIDLAVCAVMAVERATQYSEPKRSRPRLVYV